MPLEILLALVIGGIAGIAAILHLTGHSRSFHIADAETARREWVRHRSEDRVLGVHLGKGAALMETSYGIGLLRPFGADTVAHMVKGLEPTPQGLRVRFHDFAAPDVVLCLSETETADWLTLWKKHHA
jgi:hypothetical protein